MNDKEKTKPTYSELEAELADAEKECAYWMKKAADAERVRGLLQRVAEACKEPICTHARMMPVAGPCVCCERESRTKLKLAIEEALFLSIPDWPAGAESADIGINKEELCIDCGQELNNPRYHFEAPGNNWGAALHHFRKKED